MPDKKPADAPVINPEADRILGRLSIWAIIILFVSTLVATFLMTSPNTPGTPLFPYHRSLDTASVALVVVPFFWLTNKLYAARLKIGRDLVERGEYKQAIAALEPFSYWHQRFLDGSGEANYLLVKAYGATGQADKARRCRDFVLKSRKGKWAEALAEPISTPVKVSELKQKALSKGQGGVKTKPTRRF